ncbi:MAG TPA: MFS transporter, partial [Spirochaetales bacterium]|nr:MFS transporter [Spirochaetales bacterium]
MSRASALPTAKLPPEIYALFVVRLVVSAGSFVGPFLTMILTIKLGYADGAAGAFVSGVTVAGAVGLFAGGHLGDRLERAGVLRWLQAATAGIFLVCALVGFTPVTPFLMAAALVTLQGTWPLINALVADRAPPERTKEAFALIYWGNNIGFSIGPLIAGLLFDAAPRALFVGNAVALFIAAGV